MAEELIIEAGKIEKNYWKDLWRYRELFYILSLRDIKVRYKQTVLGILWSVVRPLIAMIVFTLIFSKVAKLPAMGSAPYAIMVFAGMLPWQFFANAVSESSNSLIGNTNLISKVYFPRLIIPTASVITSMIDFLIAFILMLFIFVFYHYMPGWQIIFLPLFLLIAFMLAMGVGLWITALNVKYRDFKYIVPFIVQFGLYISPVGFNAGIVPEKYRLIYNLNPMVGIIDGFRWSLLNGVPVLNYQSLLISIAVSVIFLWLGISRFRKMERKFADII